jgi:hypothetical protein
MSVSILPIPSDLLQEKSLNSTQKLILSFSSTKTKLYGLEIAKFIGSKHSQIRDDLKSLVDQGYLTSSNGQGRVSYSLDDGSYVLPPLDQEAKLLDNSPQKGLITSEGKTLELSRSDSDRGLPKEVIKEDSRFEVAHENVQKAFTYWLDRGGQKHRSGSQVYQQSLDKITELFYGTAFRDVPDTVIPQPKLHKLKKFTLEDFKTSLDNYILSLESPAYKPASKARPLAYRKALSLTHFIYNPWVKEGRTRSLFLQYLEPPDLISKETARHPKLTKQLAIKIGDLNLRSNPVPPTIIAAANIFGDLLGKYKYRINSVASTAELLPEFIEKEIGKSRFERHWLISDWFMFKFEKWLGRKGIINLEEN